MSRTFLWTAIAWFGLSPITAGAIPCQPGVLHTEYVGKNVDGETGCGFSDIQSAVDAAVCPNTTIVVSSYNGMTYTGVNVSVLDKSLSFEGTGEACNTQVICPPTGCHGAPVQIPVTGDGVHPVFSISGGGGVGFFNLDISGGNGNSAFVKGGGIGVNGSATVVLTNVSLHGNTGADGGGIAFDGGGSLKLSGVTIQNNSTQGDGGGVYVLGEPTTPIEFDILDNPEIPTVISSNQAANGGGLFVDGNVHMAAVAASASSIRIYSNTATSTGGGLAFSGTGFADLALNEADPDNPIAIGLNSATAGSGIAIAPNANGDAVLRLFSTAAGPTILRRNGGPSAQIGAAIYVAMSSMGNHATACLWDAGIVNNFLSDPGIGTAFSVSNGGRLFVNPQSNAECNYTAAVALGATHCSASDGSECNLIYGNASYTGGTQGTSAIAVSGAAQVAMQRVMITENQPATFVIVASGPDFIASFHDCVIAQNSVSNTVLYAGGGTTSIDGCTFAQNAATSSFFFATGAATLNVSRSIIAETGTAADFYADGGSVVNAQYLLDSRENQFIGNSTILANTDPMFSDAYYHLSATSPALDFAPSGNESESIDLDGNPRETDLPLANHFGPRDLGAYEYQLPDEIFKNGFD